MRKNIHVDLSGQKFGMLTVIEKMPSIARKTRWHCVCECGSHSVVRVDFLKQEHLPRSCGCMNRTLKNRPLTQERLKELFSYDAKTGEFLRIKSLKGGQKDGFIAFGSTSKTRHRSIGVDGKRYQAHRLAWFYVHGEWPKGEIDHIDHNPENNAMSNLRDGTKAQNMQNLIKPRSNNKSGYLGVWWCKGMRAWKAGICKERIYETIGYFSTAEEASIAYINRKREIHEFCTI